MSVLLEPVSFEADAVVPQCLDNQYVTDETFSYMINHRVGYDNPVVNDMREASTKTEFIRSLIYSSQVIIQRAFLKNNEFLYKNYLPQDRQNVEAFAQLIRERAVIPFLFKEASLTDNLDFDLRGEGDRALQALLSEIGDDELACVRLAVDEQVNKSETRRMSLEFSLRLMELSTFKEPEQLAMVAELFHKPDIIVEDPVAWKQFKKNIRQLARYAFDKAEEIEETNQFLSRNQVYADNFIETDGNVALGHFKKPGSENPFILELKKYVDLVYNANLPDFLQRYTFTPVGLPSRTALQDSTRRSTSHGAIRDILSDPDYLDLIRRTFMARIGKGMFLPELRHMSVADVAAVRKLPEWSKFKDAQARILKNPLESSHLIEQFQIDLNNFQLSLSKWFEQKYQPQKAEENYYTYPSLAVGIAGQTIVSGSDFNIDKIEEDKIPKVVKGYVAKLVVNVFNLEKKAIDKSRSYAIEIMQTNEELERGDVIQLLRGISQQSGEGIPSMPGQIADQGID
jgi:hypothetical protein